MAGLLSEPNGLGRVTKRAFLVAVLTASTAATLPSARGQPIVVKGTLTNPDSPVGTSARSPARPARQHPTSLNVHDIAAQSAAAATIPLWHNTATYKSVKYTYTMVGQSPFSKLTNPLTTITTWLVPVTLTFRDSKGTLVKTFSPSAPDKTCSPAGVPFDLTRASPIFQTYNYVIGGKTIGKRQFADAFQRANFWTYVQSLNPNYSVTLKLAVGPVLNLTAFDYPVSAAPCGKHAKLDRLVWDDYLQTTAFPQLAQAGVKPTDLVIFLTYNVAWYVHNVATCCVVSYHTGFHNPAFGNALQTYVSADYETSNSFTANKDIYALSHAVTAWLDNPQLSNATPAWGKLRNIKTCRKDLDTGDALAGTTHNLTMPNGFVYHVQDELFVPWFYRINPSFSVNKQFSLFASLTTDAGAVCQ